MKDTDGALLAAVRAMDERFPVLTGSVEALTESYDALIVKDRKDTRNFRLLVASVILDILLSLGLFFVVGEVRDTAAQAKAATAASRVAQNNLRVVCEASNESNAKQRLLWLPLAEVAPPNETPAAWARRLEFLDTINHTFAPRDCGT